MGSKTDVLDLIEKGISFFDNVEHDTICDLFAGSATLSAALRNKINLISNDVQEYSSVFARVYLENYQWESYLDIKEITKKAQKRVEKFNNAYPEYRGVFSYERDFTLEEMNMLEEKQRDLINKKDWNACDKYYLFVKDYSGTYWSYDQCIWIDSYRAVIDEYKEKKEYYNLLLTCLIYAMAYNSQSTGHYAQYRIPDNESSMEDILIYRRKNITDFFERKYEELRNFLTEKNSYSYETMTKTDVECLRKIPERTLVYADPPYCFVHYSRFYHIIETLVKYDYPDVKHKGRYRTDRYQSEYCKKTDVRAAFRHMFEGIVEKKSDLILSYTNSNTNTILFDELLRIVCESFDSLEDDSKALEKCREKCKKFFADPDQEIVTILNGDAFKYEIAMMKKPYNHSRMGRTSSKTIPVTEVVILAKFNK